MAVYDNHCICVLIELINCIFGKARGSSLNCTVVICGKVLCILTTLNFGLLVYMYIHLVFITQKSCPNVHVLCEKLSVAMMHLPICIQKSLRYLIWIKSHYSFPLKEVIQNKNLELCCVIII